MEMEVWRAEKQSKRRESKGEKMRRGGVRESREEIHPFIHVSWEKVMTL